MEDSIIITGAKENNLKSVNLKLPKNKINVFTGLSGSGKSTMAMDIIYAEGQRRYVESLSSYARQFLGVLKKPNVEKIDGLSPAIAIDQKTVSKNPRSTVGTITEIYDYLRLLYSKVGTAYCPVCGEELTPQTIDQIVDLVKNNAREYFTQPSKSSKYGYKLLFSAVIVNDKKGEYSSLFKTLKKQGWSDLRVDQNFTNKEVQLDKNYKHTIEVITGRIVIHKFHIESDWKEMSSEIFSFIDNSLKLEPGFIRIYTVNDTGEGILDEPQYMTFKDISTKRMCVKCGISLPDFEPRHFSFNSPHGACKVCNGLGVIKRVDENKIINPNLSIFDGGIIPYLKVMQKDSWTRNILIEVAKYYNIALSHALSTIPKEKIDKILYGTDEQKFTVKYANNEGFERIISVKYEGVIPNLERRYIETNSDFIRNEIEKYMTSVECEVCHGARLNKEALSVKILDKNIDNLCKLPIDKFHDFINTAYLQLSTHKKQIAEQILNEISTRSKFLLNVGLSYLTLSRSSETLSGGESQRIRLASQIGTGLTGVLYVLDEPSIGLHARDQLKLIGTLKELRNLGNTLIIVEHDRDTISNADNIIDFGPLAGNEGGRVIAQGDLNEIKSNKSSITGPYLVNENLVQINVKRTIKSLIQENLKFSHDSNAKIVLEGVTTNNLKNVNVEFPLGKLICVTGVSGSGKSSLIVETLLPALRKHLGYQNYDTVLSYKSLSGYGKIDRVIFVDQSPIGKTPRSNPATYTKVFDDIRELFAQTKLAKIKGYTKSRFSFNLRGGRCESCKGEGKIKIEMQFMPDVYVDCEVCKGNRYVTEVMDIKYKEKNIADVLQMSVNEAYDFFYTNPIIRDKLEMIKKIGLGYLRLGMPAPLLSGGESQRVKLASELYRKSNGRSIYILDEPTTGLHFKDMEDLLKVILTFVSRGDTAIVIEHNLDFIKMCDYIIDIGPEGGNNGGEIIYAGDLKEITKCKKSWTGKELLK